MNKTKASRRLEEERTRLQGIRDGLQREREDATSETSGELSGVDQHPGDSGTETRACFNMSFAGGSADVNAC